MNSLMLGTAVIGTIVWLTMTWLERGSNGKDEDGWARPRQLKDLHLHEPTPGRLGIGYTGKKLLATEKNHSVLVFGPTDTGKTTGLAIPAILEWEGPVLVTSVKGDLVDATLAHRSTMGTAWVFDPMGTTSCPSAKWTPLSAAGTWGGAERVAEWMCTAARSKSANLSDGDFWHNVSGMLLAPMLFAAASAGVDVLGKPRLGIADVVRWVRRQDKLEVMALLEEAAVPEALDALMANMARDDKQLSGIYTTAETILRPFADPTAASALTGSDVTSKKLLEANNTLYVCGEAHEQERIEALFATIVRQMINGAMTKASREGPLTPPLLIVLDEAANIAPVRDLAQLASTARAQGIQLVSVFQDYAQIKDRYGNRAQTVVNNHRAKVVLGGIADEDALKYVSMLLGQVKVAQESTTSGTGRDSRTASFTYRDLCPPQELRQMKPGEGVLVYGHHRPAKIRLRPYYEDPALLALSSGEGG